MQKNEVLTLRADNLGADFEGVCRCDGMTVFVPGLLPGEEAPIRIEKVEKRYAFGRMASAPVSLSPNRKKPDCPVYPQCGGCSARHLHYTATLEAKRQHVQDCFERIGHISVHVSPTLGMEDPLAYRNKTALSVGGDINSPLLGFYAPRSHRLIPTLVCPNAMPPAEAILSSVQKWMKSYRIQPYNEVTRKGQLRHVVIRVNRKHEAMVTLVSRTQNLPHTDELFAAISPLGTVSLYLNINSQNTNVIFGEDFRLLHGQEFLEDTLCGLTFSLAPAAFFQVNPLQTEVLYGEALRFGELRPEDTLIDVYCGAGTISLMMARYCKHVTGIEIVPAAVFNARENALRNGIENASFLTGKAEELLPRLVKEGQRPDVIVVDPPRKGLEQAVISAIAAASPDRLIYVSCNPATLARDAALLLDQGYSIRCVQPVDMFLFTSHVETVCCLYHQRKDFIFVPYMGLQSKTGCMTN